MGTFRRQALQDSEPCRSSRCTLSYIEICLALQGRMYRVPRLLERIVPQFIGRHSWHVYAHPISLALLAASKRKTPLLHRKRKTVARPLESRSMVRRRPLLTKPIEPSHGENLAGRVHGIFAT